MLTPSNHLLLFGGNVVVIQVFVILLSNLTTCLTSANSVRYRRQNHLKRISESISQEICETQACVHAASSILNNMDTTVNPCQNFYQFACGNYIKNTVIPDDKYRIDQFTVTNDKLQEQIRSSIENDVAADDPRIFKLLQNYFKTCMDKEQIELSSYYEFQQIVNKLGGWPVLDQMWDESTFDWRIAVIKFRNFGYSISVFFDMQIAVDMKNNSRYLIHIDQPNLGLPEKYLSKGLDEKVVQAYFKYMVDFAEIFGADRDLAKIDLLESLKFEIELAKISVPIEERRNMSELYNLMKLEELESLYPIVPWMQFVNKLMRPHVRVDRDEQIVLAVPRYFEKFAKLVTRTPKRVLANYAMWSIAQESAPMLGKRVQRIVTEFDAAMTGSNVREPRWRECVSFATSSLPIASGALYVKNHFNEQAKQEAVDVILSIRQSFHRLLEEVNWMDAKTKAKALEKLKWIQPHIAYPDEYLDNTKLDQFYQSLKIYQESFLKTELSINLFNYAYDFSLLKKPVNKTDWINHGTTAIVNAFYQPSENSIAFPAGILQGIFFTMDRPKYLNYGGIGSVMGHEMTHGFDDEGRQFDKEGNLLEWWESETKEKYLLRAQCMIDQYSNYTVKEVGIQINGINTQGENIADNGGIKEAYYAYNEWEKKNGQEPRLPGLPFNSQQMLWLSFANIWCSKYRPESQKLMLLTDVHSPTEFRVIGTMSNMPEFAKDFHCPLGSPMNPPKKCTVW